MGSPRADLDADLLFIDGMMAEIALEVSEREEIRTLAGEIIETLNAEIEQRREWREEWSAE